MRLWRLSKSLNIVPRRRSVEDVDARRAHQRLEQARQRAQRRIARGDLVRIGEEARQVFAVGGLAVAMLQAREDAEHLQVALQPDPFELAPELPEIGTHRKAGSSGRLPVADGPVDLLLFVPRQERIAPRSE